MSSRQGSGVHGVGRSARLGHLLMHDDIEDKCLRTGAEIRESICK